MCPSSSPPGTNLVRLAPSSPAAPRYERAIRTCETTESGFAGSNNYKPRTARTTMSRYSHLNPEAPQPYRLRNDRTGREVIVVAQPGVPYVDKASGEPLQVIGKLLPLTPSPSRLPWSVENLRVCPSCGELVRKDLNHCPYDGRRLPPLDPPVSPEAVRQVEEAGD